jgi:dihydroxyacetone kinase phosphotransfer subunit
MSDTVGIVIVSHSQDIAKGTADMVRQMVGSEVKVAFCGGDPGGGLGTNVPLIIEAIDKAWSPKGVAILVDLGGAETNSEMAVEMLPPAAARSNRYGRWPRNCPPVECVAAEFEEWK